MLSIPLKQTERVDLRRSLHAFVEASYSTEQADAHRDAFEEVHVLRERVRLATLTEKNHAATVATLARYYRVVTSLRTRFGAAVEDSEFAVQFVWRDAFRPPEKVARADLQYERVCVLFSVAAALSYSTSAVAPSMHVTNAPRTRLPHLTSARPPTATGAACCSAFAPSA